MKNPHGVPPTRYMKRKESKYAIYCNPKWGPIFGCRDIRIGDYDIYIGDHCNKENTCGINNNDTNAYECHSKYNKSLFVDTYESTIRNEFRVLEYEVFEIDYEVKDNINKLCKYPTIIWEYIETKDISEESLKQFDDDVELLNELDVIHCNDSNIRFKILKYYLKNTSKLLVGTQIVNEQYDDKLREWIGDYKWKLIYRTSEHGYKGESFHKYCDNKGPTLIVIKSSEGWIFGGYTTQSWRRWGIYLMNDMLIFNR